MQLVDEKFSGQYDYFYLPIDVKTQCGVGFGFINMIHPLFILDFFLEFNCVKWSDKIQKCNSTKYCEITYANVQGIEEIKKELQDKNVMKKTDPNHRPQFFENLDYKQRDVDEIEEKYKFNHQHIQFYKNQLVVFDTVRQIIADQREEQKRQAELKAAQPSNSKLTKNQKNKLRKKMRD